MIQWIDLDELSARAYSAFVLSVPAMALTLFVLAFADDRSPWIAEMAGRTVLVGSIFAAMAAGALFPVHDRVDPRRRVLSGAALSAVAALAAVVVAETCFPKASFHAIGFQPEYWPALLAPWLADAGRALLSDGWVGAYWACSGAVWGAWTLRAASDAPRTARPITFKIALAQGVEPADACRAALAAMKPELEWTDPTPSPGGGLLSDERGTGLWFAMEPIEPKILEDGEAAAGDGTQWLARLGWSSGLNPGMLLAGPYEGLAPVEAAGDLAEAFESDAGVKHCWIIG